MKKALLLVLSLAFLVGCSTDSATNSEIESIDLTKIIDPDSVSALAEFDYTTKGIYKGIFVSEDMSYHGIITINVGNDSRYNAVLEYGEGRSQRMGFVHSNNERTSNSNVIEFRGEDAGFTLNVSDYNKAVISEGYINGQGAQMKVRKQTSTNLVTIVLGTFSDDAQPSFNGFWDLIGNSGQQTISVPTTDINLPLPPGVYPPFVDVVVENLDEVIVTRNGVMFSDDKMESFRAGPNCLVLLPDFPTKKFTPFASLEQTQVLEPLIFGFPTFSWDIDEYGAGDQISELAGDFARWNIGYSYASRKWPNGTEGKYWTTNCVESPLGGTWAWKQRRGHILLILP